jgi:transcriptional regulator with XRE-family HTH domain
MDGRKALADIIRRDSRSQAQVASEVGCSPGYLSLLLDGKRWASPKLAQRLSQKFDGLVSANDLVSPKTREVADLLRAG